MRPNFDFDSRDPEHLIRLGGYYFPILHAGIRTDVGSWYRIRTYNIGANRLVDLVTAAREATFVAFTKNEHLTVVDADFKLSDLGLNLSALGSDGEVKGITRSLVREALEAQKNADWRYGSYEVLCAARESRSATRLPKQQFFSEDIVDLATQGADKDGNKLFKRAGTVTRAFRRVATRAHFRVQVIPDEENHMEGFGYINPRLLTDANEAIFLPNWNPIQRARIIKAMDRLPISNARVVGRMFDVTTGQQIVGHIKAQLAIGHDMDPEVDFVVPAEAIKTELRATEKCFWAIAGLEPQGPKDLYWDRQTVNNHPFVVSVPQLREDLTDEARKAMDKLQSGNMMRSTAALTTDEFDSPFMWQYETYNRMLRWNSNAWVAYGLSYLDSPWLTQRLGLQWPQSLGWSDRAVMPNRISGWERTLHMPVRCAKRVQIISASSYNQVRAEKDQIWPGGGEIIQGKKLPVLVVSDASYRDYLVPSHGGSDQDDFYLVLQRTVGSTFTTDDGETKDVHSKNYIVFRNPNARGEFSVWDFHEGDDAWTYVTSKGEKITFPPIRKKYWPDQILDALDTGKTNYISLPSKQDPTLGPEDDRRAVMAEQERIFTQLREDGIAIDRLLWKRLGDPAADLPKTTRSIFSLSKRVMREVIEEYNDELTKFTGDLKIPMYLRELGRNGLFKLAQQKIRASRFAMWQTQQALQGEPFDDVMRAMFKVQGRILLGLINAKGDDPAFRAQATLALWYASRVTPKSDGTFSDSPIFGTDVFREDLFIQFPLIASSGPLPIGSRWHVLDALEFYGIAHEPDISQGPTKPYVNYLGDLHWNVACTNCGTGYLRVGHKALVAFHAHKGVCRDCRIN